MGSELATDLARVQFAWTISFHIIFPSLTIGLASYLAVLEALWLKTGKATYLDLYRFWLKIFAVSFGMGVVSGVVMSFQFGTNWSRFSEVGGNVLGPLISYEVLTAFFLEAGFLGIMLFGMNRVGKGLHFFATAMVAVGTLISAFWILSANSFMHTPAGFSTDAQGHLIAEDWLEVIFNPSFPYRFVHMVLAAYLTTAFVVGAVGAWHLIRQRADERARVMFSMAMWMAVLVTPLQIVAGDAHGLNSLETNPVKIAAMEGIWEGGEGVPWTIVGWPDMEAEETLWAIEVPHLGSLILTHEWDGAVQGMKDFPAEDRPNATVIFWTFRLMVGIGLLMLAIGATGLVLRFNGRLYDSRWFHRACVVMGPSGFAAVLAGWITTEMGRQPWVIHGILRTADAVSPNVDVTQVGISLALFVIVYIPVFGTGTYYILRLMRRLDPEQTQSTPDGGPGAKRHAQRPISAAPDPAE